MKIDGLKSSVEGSAMNAKGTSVCAPGARLDCCLAMGLNRRKAQGKLTSETFRNRGRMFLNFRSRPKGGF